MTRGPYRLQSGGSSLNRKRRVHFRFDGREFSGHPGDTLASALLANGVRIVGRSFKFHRPRGVFSSGSEEPNALVNLESGPTAVPSARAPRVEIREALSARAQSGWPSVNFDVGRVLDLAAPLWAAGFYNKAFMWPNWRFYEHLVRRMAGLASAPDAADPDRYDVRNAHCDVLVIGAGVSGLREARIAAHAGLRVLVADRNASLGGRGGWNGSLVNELTSEGWIPVVCEELARNDRVTLLPRTYAVAYHDHHVVTLVEELPHERFANSGGRLPRERLWVVRTSRIVLATGGTEQPMVFSNNDRPGIMLAGAAHEYLERFGIAPGRAVLVATNNDSAYEVARALKTRGVGICALIDSRREVADGLLRDMQTLAITVHLHSMPVDTAGFSGLSSVTIGRLSNDDEAVLDTQRIECDALAVSGGWTPSLQLFSQAGGKLRFNEQSKALEASSALPSIAIVGERSESRESAALGTRLSPVGKTHRQWVDLRHDVTVADLELAVRENFRSIEHVKRYTTVGMSVDQGKTSNVLTIEIVSRLRGEAASDMGHTTFRPPLVPVTLGTWVGRSRHELFAPFRHGPLNGCHTAVGALLEDYGEWRRPAAYPKCGESREAAIRREMSVVRSAVALFDATPLGKIEVQGPDAQEFLEKFYINLLATLGAGRVRYGLMLRESGVIFDDGTVTALTPQHFLLTTTSGNARRVGAWLEEWHQCEWPQMRVAITPVTERWATISVTGPRSRSVLAELEGDIDWSSAAFPHMSFRAGRLLGRPVRVYRVSFTGELTYEINVPSRDAIELWTALSAVGEKHGLQPIGVEALLNLRLEKGFLHIGTDTDGSSVPADIGWGKVAAAKPIEYIGKRSLFLPENLRCDRLQLIGLRSEQETIVVGSHLRLPGTLTGSDGWVTSAGRLSLDSQAIGLALLRAGREKIGQSVRLYNGGKTMDATVVEPMFYDRGGERMNA